uniref:Uncharacterized protein n=1 Tax=Meloidogyne enterolobii TaxID=390850 RepID=A0A6V7UHL3_MELEN|nr:unnamed protein product [Meloidogyne enterolobii]
MHIILKMHDWEKEIKNKVEFSDVQKELLVIDGMKDKMTKSTLEILYLIYTKNETTKEEVEDILEEKLGLISEAETKLNRSGYIDQKEILEGLEKRRKTFSSIKSFMNDYNQAVEQIVLLLNKEKPEIQQITTYYKKLRLYRGMNDAVEMLYISSYRLALSSEQKLKGFQDNYEKVEQLKAKLDEEIVDISSKYGLTGKKRFEKLGDIKTNEYSSIRKYLIKIKNLYEDFEGKGKILDQEDVKRIEGLKEDLHELNKFYKSEKLWNDLLDSDKFYKNTISDYLKRIEKEEKKIDGKKSHSFGKERETQMAIKEEESSSIKANLRKSKSSKPSFSSQSSLNSQSSNSLQPSLNSQSSFNSQTSSDSGESSSQKSLNSFSSIRRGLNILNIHNIRNIKNRFSKSAVMEDIATKLEGILRGSAFD